MKKREGYRKAFANFDVEQVPRFNEEKIQEKFGNYIWRFVDGKPLQNNWVKMG